MKFRANSINQFGGMVQIPVPKELETDIARLQDYVSKGKYFTVEIKRELRSNDANAYAWVLCREIAKKLSEGQIRASKEDVYKRAIKECGFCTILPIKKEALESWKRIWSGNGVGWLTEELGDSKLKGYVNIGAYHGSSTYDSKEMSALINNLVQECEALGVPTRPKGEIDKLVREWGLRE